MIFALLLQAAIWDEPLRTNIPEAYRGEWTLDTRFCGGDRGPAFVEIGAREIHFYERHAYLRLARLNEASDSPSFYGQFDVNELLDFSEETIRIEPAHDGISITEGQPADGPSNTMVWHRCPEHQRHH